MRILIVEDESAILGFLKEGLEEEGFAVDLADNGKFISKPTIVFSIENMGLRGDDKIRKIVYNNKDNTLTINSLEFNFNLAAVLNKPETNFKLKYDLEKKSWYRVN